MGKPKLTKTREQNIFTYKDSNNQKKYAYRYRYTRSDGKKADAYKQNFKTIKEATLALIQIKAELLEGRYLKIDNADMTVNELCGIYLKYKQKQWKVSTYKTNIFVLNAVCKKIGDMKVKKLNKVNYYSNFIEPQLSSISATTVHSQHRVFNTVLNFAVEEELIDKNRIRGIHVDHTIEHRVLEKDVLKQVLHFAENKKPIMYPGVAILAYTGMRLGEVCGLKWEDIDFENKTISINRTFDRYGERSPKTRNSIRTLPLPSVIEDILKKLKKKREQEYFKKTASITPNMLDKKHVLLNRASRPCKSENFQIFFQSLYEKEGIFCRAHMLRHTYATILIGEGFDIATVASLLGDTIETIQKVYVHSIDEQREKAVNHFDKIITKII